MNRTLLIILAIAVAAGFSLFLLTTGGTRLDAEATTATVQAEEVTEAKPETADTPVPVPEPAGDEDLLADLEGVAEAAEAESVVSDTDPSSSPLKEVPTGTEGHPPFPYVWANVVGNVLLPTDTLAEYQAEYFTYVHEGEPIEFFIIKTATGILRAAFNACLECYPERQGYRQDGNVMICNFCGRQFSADLINVEEGGCSPIPLDRRILGSSQLQISVDDIIRGALYF